MTALRFIVPGPPIPKARARVVASAGGKAHAFTPAATARYEKTVATYALRARLAHAGPWPLDARYRVELWSYRRREADLDNIIKSALDACNGVLWTDDAQVDEIHARRRADDGACEQLIVDVFVLGSPS